MMNCPYDAGAANAAAAAKISAWAERLGLERLKECQEKGDVSYSGLSHGDSASQGSGKTGGDSDAG